MIAPSMGINILVIFDGNQWIFAEFVQPVGFSANTAMSREKFNRDAP